MHAEVGAHDIIDVLRECHDEIRRVVARLALDPQEHLASACRFFESELPLHAQDEEESVLPRLRGKDKTLDRELQDLCKEHDEQVPGLQRLLELARIPGHPDELADLARRIQSLLVVHLAREERTLFPAIRTLVGPREREMMLMEHLARRTAPRTSAPPAG